MKKYMLVVILVLLSFGSISCYGETNGNESVEVVPEKLVVFAVADITMTDYGEEFFSTRYNIGEFSALSEKWGPESYIFYDAICSYQMNTGIEIEVYYFMQTLDLLEALKQCINTDKCPDIIIGSYAAQDYCLYSYFQDEYFADLKPLFDEDEMYSSGEYFSNILNAGMIDNKQYVFPLTFNMNVLLSSKESMQLHDLGLSEDMSYSDIITLFTESWRQEYRENNELLMMQFTNYQNAYPYGLFQASSGENIIDYETGKIILNKEYFYELSNLYESFILNDYDMTQEELTDLAGKHKGNLSYRNSKYNQIRTGVISDESPIDIFDALHEKVGCFAEGGNKTSYMHSFAAQTYYYESRYEDNQRDFVCYGIPSRGSSDEYVALVTNYGAVMANSPYVEYAYGFLKALADSQPFIFLDMSVNKVNSFSRIEEFSSLYYELYPNLGKFPPEDQPEGVNWFEDPYKITPLSENSKEYLIYLLDNISCAKLPEGLLNEIITIEIEEYIYGDTETLEQAYENVSQQLLLLGFHN